MLKLMYITNNPEVAAICQEAGIDRVFVDMEYVGKDVRQAGLDSVKNHHTLRDVARLRKVVTTSELLVRCNPIHCKTEQDLGSAYEIDQLCNLGADIIMLPFFKTPEEVDTFVKLVDGRAKTMLLVETKEAADRIDEILAINGVDEIYIGLNDLSISLGKDFMFQPLAEGFVDELVLEFKSAGLPYGFGGIGSIGKGLLPASEILGEHYRLGSSSVILSRTFCNVTLEKSIDAVRQKLIDGVNDMRAAEREIVKGSFDFEANRASLISHTEQIAASIHARKHGSSIREGGR